MSKQCPLCDWVGSDTLRQIRNTDTIVPALSYEGFSDYAVHLASHGDQFGSIVGISWCPICKKSTWKNKAGVNDREPGSVRVCSSSPIKGSPKMRWLKFFWEVMRRRPRPASRYAVNVRVSMTPAFIWNCPACKGENCTAAVPVELNGDEIFEASLVHHGEYYPGYWQCPPCEFNCEYCGAVLKTQDQEPAHD